MVLVPPFLSVAIKWRPRSIPTSSASWTVCLLSGLRWRWSVHGGLPSLSRVAAAPTLPSMAEPSVKTCIASMAFSASSIELSLSFGILIVKGILPVRFGLWEAAGIFSILFGLREYCDVRACMAVQWCLMPLVFFFFKILCREWSCGSIAILVIALWQNLSILSGVGSRKAQVLSESASAKINFSYSILFHLTTSYSSYFGGKKGISRNKTSFFLLMRGGRTQASCDCLGSCTL